MKNISAADVAAKWNTRAGAATSDYVAGVNAVTVNPGQAAAAAVNTWVQNTTAAAPKWQAKLSNLNLATWKAQTAGLGSQRYAQGVTAAQSKYQAAMVNVLAAEQTIVNSLPARGNVQANIQRSVAFQQAMHNAAQAGL